MMIRILKEYKRLIEDMTITEIYYLIKIYKTKIMNIRKKYKLRDDIEIWNLNISYDDKKNLYGNYKQLQTILLYLYNEYNTMKMYKNVEYLMGYRPEKSVSNWNLDNDNYIACYDEDYNSMNAEEIKYE